MSSQTGRCHCGAITFDLGGPVTALVHCHCRNCRRANGGAFSTVTPASTAAFRITSGASHLREFPTSTGARFFCDRCGGRLFSRPSVAPEYTNVLVGTLDEEPPGPGHVHVNVEHKAPWFEIADDLPQHAGMPGEGDA